MVEVLNQRHDLHELDAFHLLVSVVRTSYGCAGPTATMLSLVLLKDDAQSDSGTGPSAINTFV